MISIIVPVYNVENYIRECLDSILAQTFSSFELILVDDGSTDNSGRICEEYGEKDPRIRVFHKENEGPSAARNMGLDEALGDYICFIDSDDTVREDYLEKLYGAMLINGSDMVFCDFETDKLIDTGMPIKSVDRMDSRDAKKWLYDTRSRQYVIMVVVWNKIYSKELFRNVRFEVGKIHEDEILIGSILNRCRNISFLNERLYYYRDNESGITAKANRLDLAHLDGVDALKLRIDQAVSVNDLELAEVTLKSALYKCARFYGDAGKVGFKAMKAASRDKYTEIYNGYKWLFTIKQRIKYLVFCVSPSIFIKKFKP